MSDESIKSPGVSNNSLAPALNYINAKLRVKFYGSSLKQGKIILTHKQVVNIYIVYDTNLWQFSVGKDFALGNPLFGTILILIDIGFDVHGSFSLAAGSGFGKNVIIFVADMNSSVHVDNYKKRYLNSW